MNKHLLAQELFKPYRNFRLLLTEGEITFLEFRQKFEADMRCPEQKELAPVLLSFQKIALTFADFLESLNKVLIHKDWILVIQQMLLENHEPTFLEKRDLLVFPRTISSIRGDLYERNIAISNLLQQTYALAIEYTGASDTTVARGALHPQEMINLITGTLKVHEVEQERDLALEGMVTVIAREYIQGLGYIAERALFLATATEEQLRRSETAWWCMLVDSTPKDRRASYKLNYLIESGSDLKHPQVIKRLKELSENENVADFIQERAKLKLKEIEV